MKKMIIIVSAIVLSIVLLVASLPFVFGGIDEGVWFYGELFDYLTTPNPPRPEITYGEFPFTLVFELNGEEKVVEDVLIVEFAGITSFNGGHSRSRHWNYRFESGDRLITLLRIDETTVIHSPTISMFSVGYYMGDAGSPIEISQFASRHNSERDPNFIGGGGYLINPEELLDVYGIRIISWEIAPPIENTFR